VGFWYALEILEDTWHISGNRYERQGSYGIGTSKYADESESLVYYNHHCETLHWELSGSNFPDA